MTTRRTFIQAAAFTAWPGAAATFAITAGAGDRLVARAGMRAAIVDEDHAPAREFSARLSHHGIAKIALRSGDITAAWLGSVRPAWQHGRASFAGLTTPGALFCLEQLAHAYGLRVVFHAEHVLLRDGGVQHQVQRAARPAAAATLSRAGAHWPRFLADALMNLHPGDGRRPGPSLAALAPALPEGATLLTSWIIA